MQVHRGDDARVQRDCKKVPTLEADHKKKKSKNKVPSLPLEFIGYQKGIKQRMRPHSVY